MSGTINAVAKACRAALADTRLSQEHAAHLLGVNRKTVIRWLNGQCCPRVCDFVALTRLTKSPERYVLMVLEGER